MESQLILFMKWTSFSLRTRTTGIISINKLYVQDVSDLVIIHHNYKRPVSAHIFKISHMSVSMWVHTLFKSSLLPIKSCIRWWLSCQYLASLSLWLEVGEAREKVEKKTSPTQHLPPPFNFGVPWNLWERPHDHTVGFFFFFNINIEKCRNRRSKMWMPEACRMACKCEGKNDTIALTYKVDCLIFSWNDEI